LLKIDKRYSWRFAFSLAVALAIIVVRQMDLFSPIDAHVYSYFGSSESTALKIFTETASLYSFSAIIALLLAYQFFKLRGFKQTLLDFISAFILSSILTLFIKYFTAVPRPGQPVVTNSLFSLLSDVYSFPSGHTSRSSVGAYYLSKKGKLWGVVSWIYVFLIAFSRIALGVHWFSDVIGGIAIGFLSGATVDLLSPSLLEIYRVIFRKRVIRQQNIREK